jgi:hypothetical protein
MVVKMNPDLTFLFITPMTMTLTIARGGIRFFPDLSSIPKDELHFTQNSIRIVPEECLPRNLKWLDLKYNSIASDGLPAVFPATLEQLELDGNRIRDFRDVQQFPPNLKGLTLTDNPITSLDDIYSIESLETLNVGKTNLETISLLPRSLKQLLASKCFRLRMLPNRFPSTLRIAVLNDCSLRYASLPGYWGSVEELNLANNEIERFPRNLPPCLKMLNLSGNKLRDLPEEFNQKFPSLEVCLLASNKLRRVPVQRRVRKLVFVDLCNNLLIQSVEDQNRLIEHTWASTISEHENWTDPIHTRMALRIQTNWRLSRTKRRLRTWKRTRGIRDELMCVSMMPERVWQTDVISKEWMRDRVN